MKRRFNGLATIAVMALVGALILSSPAQAAFKIEILDRGVAACAATAIGGAASACNVYITDQVALASDGTTGDTSLGALGLGIITQTNALGGGSKFTTTSTTDQSKPVIGPGKISSSAFTVSASGGGTLIIAVTDTDFPTPGGFNLLQQQLSLTSFSGLTSYTGIGYESNTNGEFALTNATPMGSLTLPATGTTTLSGPINIVPNYSLTEVMTVTFGAAGGSANFTSNLELVAPEPASVALLGGVLLLVSGALRRKFQRN